MKHVVRHPLRMALSVAILLSILVCFQSCEEKHPLEKACGEWVSKRKHSSFRLFQEKGIYFLEMHRKKWGKEQVNTYVIKEQGGSYFVQAGFTLLLSYDDYHDIIFLSTGGEYIRKNP